MAKVKFLPFHQIIIICFFKLYLKLLLKGAISFYSVYATPFLKLLQKFKSTLQKSNSLNLHVPTPPPPSPAPHGQGVETGDISDCYQWGYWSDLLDADVKSSS